VWDVSCERQIQIQGKDANKLVQWMTPRDISKAQSDQCFYLPLCDQHGKLMNDPVGIKIDEQTWWLSISDSDILLWAKGLAFGKGLNVVVSEPDVGPIAIQGPKADELMSRVFGDVVGEIRFFRYKRLAYKGHEFIVARSGWSKQGGFEVYIDHAELGQALWDELFEVGEDLNVGHGSPNLIERVESGLMSFGSDMDFRHTPLECGLEKFCNLDSNIDSMSLPALRNQRDDGIQQKLVGIVGEGMSEQPDTVQLLVDGENVGEITSHSISAKYYAWLAFAMIDLKTIEDLSSGKKTLTIKTEHGEFAGIVSRLPFKFDQLELYTKTV
jgi:dimethylsulfoniopropionate demethylase